MKKIVFISIIFFLALVSCKKDEEIPVSGTVTIDNTTGLSQTYYVYGFLFSQAKIVSTLDNPPPDITVDSDGADLFFQTNNLKDSFNKYGEYENASAAENAFDNLNTINVAQWTGLAYSIQSNQVWIYRTGNEYYAKMRIISTVSEERDNHDYAECTFEWVYQPDGSLTFPDK